MTNIHKLFLQILKAAMCGEQLHIEDDFQTPTENEWLELFQLAQNHKVLPLVYEAVYHLPQLQPEVAPFMMSIKGRVVQQVMLQSMKTDEFLKLYQHLQQAGVTPLVVKGLLCRSLYPKPDHRQSSDEDLLIAPEEFAKCHQAMEAFGMHATQEANTFEDSYEISYRKEKSPLYIELHKYLFAPKADVSRDWNVFFQDAQKREVKEIIQGVPVYSLDYTDHLFYLICHAFKHFVHSGFGIRQVCDMALFAQTYGNQVDWQRIIEDSRQIRGEKFAVAVFKMGEHFLGFDPEKACIPSCWREMEVDELPMLEDLLDAGVYGGSTMSRKHSSNITLQAASGEQGTSSKKAVWRTIFPSAKALEGRYPYLKSAPVLLPIAWVSRIFAYFLEVCKGKDNSATEAMEIGKQRMELLARYDIIEK